MTTEPVASRAAASAPTGLSALWNARSVAVVGASERPGSLGRLPVDYLRRYGYQGRVVPVNPNAETVLGLSCYPSLAAASGPIDLALLLVAAPRVPDAIDDCAKAGVPVAIVGASGFAEAGEVELQAEVVRRGRAGDVRVVGPNCIGAVGAANRQVVSFSPLFAAPDVPMRGGSLAFVTQSGALGYGAVSLAYERGLGLGWVVNTGNEADVTAVEVLGELARLDDCASLLAYIETMTDGPAWRALAELGKPIAVLKAGESEAGARAATSHTGALAATDRVVDGVLRQLGIARAHDVDELLDIGEAFTMPRRPAGRRVAVVTTSGGSGILAADAIAASASTLRLAELSPRTTEALAAVVPAFGSVENPVDVTATVMSDPTLFDRCLDLVAEDAAVDSLVACFCVLTGADVDHIVAGLGRVARRSAKPVVVARTGADFLAPDARAELAAAGIPVYATPAQAVRALAAVTLTTARRRPHVSHEGHPHAIGPGEVGCEGAPHIFRDRVKGTFTRPEAPAATGSPESVGEASRSPASSPAGLESEFGPTQEAARAATPERHHTADGRAVLPQEWPAAEPELKAMLRNASLPVPRGRVVASPSEATVLVNELGGHAVFKAVVPSLVHKTEAGGVVLDVTPDAAPEVYERLAALGGRVYAEEMVTGGVEMLVGVTSTPLGRVITVASGGLLTEVLDDAVFRLLPIDTADAEEMLTELRGAAVLRGARGRPPADVAALADLLVRVGSLVLDVKRIPPLPPGADLDLNPVAVLTQGVAILDAALTFGDPLPA